MKVRIGILTGEGWRVLKGKRKHAVVEALDGLGQNCVFNHSEVLRGRDEARN